MTVMCTTWQQWCRLCATAEAGGKQNNLLTDAQESTLAAIRRYFDVHIGEADTAPKTICGECFSLISSLVNYADYVAKVQEMYKNLQKHKQTGQSQDFAAVRLRFGILSEEKPQVCIEQPIAELQFVATKTETDDVEADTSADEIESATNPLDTTPLDDIKTDEEQVETAPHIMRLEELSCDDKSADELEEAAVNTDAPVNADGNDEIEVLVYETHTAARSESPNVSDDTAPTDECTKKCHLCQKRVKNLHIHLKRAHAIDLRQRCDQCPRVFVTEHQLRKHQRHHLPFEIRNTLPCPHCTSKFSTQVLLRLHISRMHMETEAFICEECGISVRTKASLKVHMLIHGDYMPFRCEICQKGFRHKCALKVHLDTHDPNKHICALCGSVLSSKLMLKRHMVVHSDVLQHKCGICGRGFKRSKTLKNHLLVHSGLKPYACEFCERTFTTGPNCRAHKKRKHADELAASMEAGGCVPLRAKLPKLKELMELSKATKVGQTVKIELPTNKSSLQEI